MSHTDQPAAAQADRVAERQAILSKWEFYDFSKSRMDRALDAELSQWSTNDILAILDLIHPFPRTSGSRDTCGPKFNKKEALSVQARVGIGAAKAAGIAALLPAQIGVAAYMGIRKGDWRAALKEAPRPSLDIARSLENVFTMIKPPSSLVAKSIAQRKALCVNRLGQFKLLGADDSQKYAVLSYVWGELMAWSWPGRRWGAVDIAIRREGLPLDHLERVFDLCCTSITSKDYSSQENEGWTSRNREYDYEWMWLDVLAMPEVLEDMNEMQRKGTEGLRVGVINTLSVVYANAGRVTIADALCRRLHTGSMLDCAIVLSIGRWASRLWSFTECRLARKVVVRTAEYAYDLDEIIYFLNRTVLNDEHRYWVLLWRIAWWRPTPKGSDRMVFDTSEDREIARAGGELHIWRDIFHATTSRTTNVRIDHARALFPLLGLNWEAGWDVKRGFDRIREAFPDHVSEINRYYEFRKDVVEKQNCVLGKVWNNAVVDDGLAEAYE